MCGIFAAISFNKPFNSSDKERFDFALNQLNHRGPDYGESKTFNPHSNEESKFQIYFGHKRLSILDISPSANQPFEADGLEIIFNGEILNFIELREDLKEFDFKTKSDVEVILRAYQKFGAECFAKFNGFWALIIFDKAKEQIIVCRDRFSIKPLYYMTFNDGIYFASETKAFKKLGKPLTPNHQTLGFFLNQKIVDSDENTFYNEIKHFPAMHYSEIDIKKGQQKTHKYWDYKPYEYANTYKERKEQFRALLIDSLKLNMRSDVAIGTLLSGGLDSSSITTLVHDNFDQDVNSFSLVSDIEEYSEERFIDKLVQENKINNFKLDFKENLSIESIQSVLDVQDEPFGSLSIVAQNLLFKQIKNESDIKVILCGQGADEVLLGYKKYFFLYLKQLVKRKKIGKAFLTAGSSFIRGTTLHEFNWKEAKRYLPGRIDKGINFFTKEMESKPIWNFTNMAERQIDDINLYSVPSLCRFEDRNSMANGIEVRLPFLDYRLVNFLVHAPLADKLKGGWTKYILRDSMHELPKEIRWRKDKKGFITPEANWLQGGLGNHITEYFSSHSRLEEEGFIDRKKFMEAIKAFKSNSKWVNRTDIISVYVSEMWLREKF